MKKRELSIMRCQDELDSRPYYTIVEKRERLSYLSIFYKTKTYHKTVRRKVYDRVVNQQYKFLSFWFRGYTENQATEIMDIINEFDATPIFEYGGIKFYPCLQYDNSKNLCICYKERYSYRYYGQFDYGHIIYWSKEKCIEVADKRNFKPTKSILKRNNYEGK